MSKNKIEIYVVDLADYNNGHINAKWINLTSDGDVESDADRVKKEISDLLKKSKHGGEEHAIHDYHGFAGFSVPEHPKVDWVVQLAHAIKKNGEAFAAYAGDVGLEFAIQSFSDRFLGIYDKKEDYIEEVMKDEGTLSGLSEDLRCYFDVEAYTRDSEINGLFNAYKVKDGYAIFSPEG